MSKTNKDTLGYLGLDYQTKLMNQLLTDKKFGMSILDIITPNAFDEPFYRNIVDIMADSWREKELVLDVQGVKTRLASKTVNDTTTEKNLTYIKQILEVDSSDCDYTQELAMKFFKQQNLKKAMRDMSVILERGDIDDYDEMEGIIKKALESGDNKDDGIDVTSNIEDVLKEDYRSPVPTGIKGLDEIMEGGLAKGELGIVLAALGVGKTTMLSKIASTAKDCGLNVVQIFFEDLPKAVQRKHLACWSGIEMNDLSKAENSERLLALNEEKRTSGGKLILKRMSSDSTNIPKIRKYIKQLMSRGVAVDMVIIDYIDVVQPSRKYEDNNIGEGSIMREFETMLYELDLVGWTAIQGNRSAITSNFVETDQMGGSIKKAQIGHFIVSVAKSLEQKDARTANMAILKSRFGRDGITFEDIIFDNSRVHVELTEHSGGKSFLQTKEKRDEVQKVNLSNLLQNIDAKKRKNNEE